MSTHKMYIMHGLPGSGKSTKAKEIFSENPYNSVILSTDDYWSSNGHYFFDPNRLGQAHEWNRWRTEQACKKGIENIIIDNTNLTFKEIRPYIQLCELHNYKFEIIEPQTNWKDSVKACMVLNTHNVPYEVIEKMKQRKYSVAQLQAEAVTYLVSNKQIEFTYA